MKRYDTLKADALDFLMENLQQAVASHIESYPDDPAEGFVDCYISDQILYFVPEEISAPWFARLLGARPDIVGVGISFRGEEVEKVQDLFREAVAELIKRDIAPMLEKKAVQYGLRATQPKPPDPSEPPELAEPTPFKRAKLRGLGRIAREEAAAENSEVRDNAPMDAGPRQ